MTDALAIAVSEAQAYGLNVAPVEMHIVSGRLGEFHIAHSTLVDDSMLVYIVWLTTPEFVLYIGPGVRVTNVYIVVRTDTGEPFQITGRTGPWGELASLPWARVTTADIGRFPVPNPVYHSDEALGATRTPTPPASVSPSPSATQDYGVPTLPPPTPWPSLPTATVAAVP